jgi:hypothetical protein
MKVAQTPQEGNKTHDGKRKALYVQDDNGVYTMVSSLGWEVEEIATYIALDELKEQQDEAKRGYFDGKLSALKFHMYQKRMDLPILSCAVGICKWRVKRHFKASVFAKLSNKTLQKYAEALDMDIDSLLTIEKD